MTEDTRRDRPAGGMSRREALQLTLAAGISATAITLAVTDPAAAAATVFLHGVASGDPRRDRVVIWTRVTLAEAEESVSVSWRVATDAAMTKVVRTGKMKTNAARDYTVKVDVDGLSPGKRYYYQFVAAGHPSPIGRTRTLPETGVEKLKFAVFSCSNFELGYFNAYAEAAKLSDLDAVIHLGDYIYEYGPDGYTTPAAALGLVTRPRATELAPAEEILLLDQYRARHALYRTDAGLQALHQANPFINIWDDHEVANDAWKNGAENHDPATEGNWRKRRAAGVKAFYEWLPIRDPKDGDPIDPDTHLPDDLYRVFDFGDLATLIMTDSREAGRDQQLDSEALINTYAAAAADGTFPLDVTAAGTPRQLLGPKQERWLEKQIAASEATWQIIGNQVLMFYQVAPDIFGSPTLTAEEKTAFIALLDQLFGAGFGNLIAQLGAAGLPFPVAADAWTGYPTARVAMLKALAAAKNPVVISGDSHNAWTANLALPDGSGGTIPVAPEFGGTSVSSPGFEQYLLGVDPATVAALLVDSSARKSPTDKLIYADASRRGFFLLDVTQKAVAVDYVFVSSVFDDGVYTTDRVKFRVPVGARAAKPVA